jgi:predicted Zn-dependent protease
MLDGMTFGPDPRNGYFRGNTFYHPGLRFQFAFPQGWKSANLPDQVVAQSPEGNEALQLQAGKGSPDQAAKQFFSQQGLRAGQVQRGTVNGLETITGDFAAQTQDGTAINGQAAFLSYGGSTFAIIGMAGGGADVSGPFREMVRSFRPLTDPALLNVKAATVRSVRVPRDMTVQQFDDQFPSTIPVEELAVINGVDGPSSTLEGGRLAKQVLGGSRTQQTARDNGVGSR